MFGEGARALDSRILARSFVSLFWFEDDKSKRNIGILRLRNIVISTFIDPLPG